MPTTNRAKHTPANTHRQGERGNVFIFILLGIVLFAALSYVMARGFRSEGTDRMSDKRAGLIASDIFSYGSNIARAVERTKRKGHSETEIDFSNSIMKRHTDPAIDWTPNPNCSDTSCRVFESGGVKARIFEDASNGNTLPNSTDHPAGGHPSFHRISVKGIGTDAEDLLMLIVFLKPAVCEAINKKLNLPSVDSLVQEAWNSFGLTARSAAVGYWQLQNTESSEPLFDEDTSLAGTHQGCYNQSAYEYTYYQVLIAR